jgi:quinoprotein glucose dehydrogenase
MRHLPALLVVLYGAASLSAMAAGGQGAARSVWDGAYTDAQAARGRILYAGNCAECHGGTLQGGEGPALAGEKFWTSWREQTVGDLLGHVSKNMPFSEDGSLAGTLPMSTYVDIVAHILKSNELPTGSAELTQQSASAVRIIAKDGPGELPATTLARVVGCLEKAGSGWRLVKASSPERVTPANQNAAVAAAPLGNKSFALMFVLTRLDKYAGWKMTATGALIGEGGVDGINVTTVTPVAEKCE